MSVASLLVFVKCFDLDRTTFFQQEIFPLNVIQAEHAGSRLQGGGSAALPGLTADAVLPGAVSWHSLGTAAAV